MSNNPKSNQVAIRLSDEDEAAVAAKAESLGLNVSAYIRMLIKLDLASVYPSERMEVAR